MEQRSGLRITTWNVNGIRNPFSYQPWSRDRTFASMFDILESDIVVMQETKIQRKDLRDDMVLVPGWDVFFSLPKHKKGYSGVAIYTRNSICAPIRAEEGITGILTSPNSTIGFRELPESQQIGGYPSVSQMSDLVLDANIIDSEGRCVVLEFPAFVLIGVYCPATRDETRDDFRLGFLTCLDARVRNLVAMGKRVYLTGDLNIIREERDTANAEEQLKKQGLSLEKYLSTPARRIFNQLLLDGKVFGDRDEGRERAVMWDLTRLHHPERRGMFTCWEQKINARPGNFGSRIDYALCSYSWNYWFCESNIQEGLMGSDHCPVYAVLKQKVDIGGKEVDIRDVMSDGIFEGGVRKRDWSAKDLLPTSARLIPEFSNRRNIRDMFAKRPSLPTGESSMSEAVTSLAEAGESFQGKASLTQPSAALQPDPRPIFESTQSSKRPIETVSSARAPKKSKGSNTVSKASTATKGQPGKGQSTLKGFFKPKTPPTPDPPPIEPSSTPTRTSEISTTKSALKEPSTNPPDFSYNPANFASSSKSATSPTPASPSTKKDIDPVVAKESWNKLLGKRVVPRCSDHNEPCISMKTKKAGENCGRSFYMCSRPLGPSGQKEKGTQWRCGTFIWSSDWTGDAS